MLSRVLGRTYNRGELVRDDRGKQVGIVGTGDVTYSNFHQAPERTPRQTLLRSSRRRSRTLSS